MKKNSMPNIIETFKVSSDSGKYNSKLVATNCDEQYEVEIFRTTVIKDEKSDGKNIVIYNGERYIVGDDVEEISDNQNTMDKANMTHKIATLTGVCNLMEKCGYNGAENVLLTVNMPLSKYTDTKERERTQRLYEGSESVQITVNGNYYEFNIETELYYEGYGASNQYFELKEDEVDEPFIVLMLGSENVSAILFDEDGRPVKSQARCIEGGAVKIIEEVQNELLPIVGRTYSSQLTQSIIKKQKSNIKKEIFEVVESVCKKHLTHVKNRLQKLGIEFDTYNVYVVGGGAILFKEYIEDVFGENATISYDPIFEDAKGALSLLEE